MYEPLAWVSWDVAVPWFPGKGGRRTDRAGVFLPFGVKKKWHGWAEGSLRIAHARGSAQYYSTNVLFHKRFSKNWQYFKISHFHAEIQVSTGKIMRSTNVATQARPENAALVASLQFTMPTCVGFPITESAQADFVNCGCAVLTAGIENMIM
jgi:hypothetical protein